MPTLLSMPGFAPAARPSPCTGGNASCWPSHAAFSTLSDALEGKLLQQQEEMAEKHKVELEATRSEAEAQKKKDEDELNEARYRNDLLMEKLAAEEAAKKAESAPSAPPPSPPKRRKSVTFAAGDEKVGDDKANKGKTAKKDAAKSHWKLLRGVTKVIAGFKEPNAWEMHRDQVSGMTYWSNKVTDDTSWRCPPCLLGDWEEHELEYILCVLISVTT